AVELREDSRPCSRRYRRRSDDSAFLPSYRRPQGSLTPFPRSSRTFSAELTCWLSCVESFLASGVLKPEYCLILDLNCFQKPLRPAHAKVGGAVILPVDNRGHGMTPPSNCFHSFMTHSSWSGSATAWSVFCPVGWASWKGVRRAACRKISSLPAIWQKPRSASSVSARPLVSFHITATESSPNRFSAESRMPCRYGWIDG